MTDAGFFEVASALVEALAYDGVHGRCARLEELCLKDNQLTIASLQAMTPIIQLACSDLRDLDLSGSCPPSPRIPISYSTEVLKPMFGGQSL